jgi:hypothetical protein
LCGAYELSLIVQEALVRCVIDQAVIRLCCCTLRCLDNSLELFELYEYILLRFVTANGQRARSWISGELELRGGLVYLGTCLPGMGGNLHIEHLEQCLER